MREATILADVAGSGLAVRHDFLWLVGAVGALLGRGTLLLLSCAGFSNSGALLFGHSAGSAGVFDAFSSALGRLRESYHRGFISRRALDGEGIRKHRTSIKT